MAELQENAQIRALINRENGRFDENGALIFIYEMSYNQISKSDLLHVPV